MKSLSFKLNNWLPLKSPNNKWQIQNLNFVSQPQQDILFTPLHNSTIPKKMKRKFLLIDFLGSLKYYGAVC